MSGRYTIAAREDRLSLLGERGVAVWAIEHPRWDGASCEFSAEGDLVRATMPGPDHAWEDDEADDEAGDAEADGPAYEWDRTYEEPHAHQDAPENHGGEWWVVEAATGRVLATGPLGTYPDGAVAFRHPDGVHMGLGTIVHDGPSHTFWGSYVDGRLHVIVVPSAGRLMSVHPAGTAYVTLTTGMTDDDPGGTLTLHGFPDHETIARWPGTGLVRGEWFGGAEYLDGERVLVKVCHGTSASRWLLFDARDLKLLGEAEDPCGPAPASGDTSGRA
ncbi:hypothetical protein ACGFSI_12370 [Streptomyces virginiae]|uniref:hypothetical protein n=1 Tax=Streptomyces virginiae TaxID=1961 RepID=UPI0037236E1C